MLDRLFEIKFDLTFEEASFVLNLWPKEVCPVHTQ